MPLFYVESNGKKKRKERKKPKKPKPNKLINTEKRSVVARRRKYVCLWECRGARGGVDRDKGDEKVVKQ